jgi:hypothetical protein
VGSSAGVPRPGLAWRLTRAPYNFRFRGLVGRVDSRAGVSRRGAGLAPDPGALQFSIQGPCRARGLRRREYPARGLAWRLTRAPYNFRFRGLVGVGSRAGVSRAGLARRLTRAPYNFRFRGLVGRVGLRVGIAPGVGLAPDPGALLGNLVLGLIVTLSGQSPHEGNHLR